MNYVECEMHEATHVKWLFNYYPVIIDSLSDTKILIRCPKTNWEAKVQLNSDYPFTFQFYKEYKIEPVNMTAKATPVFDCGHDVGLCLHLNNIPERFRDKNVKVTIEVVE